MRDRLEKPKWLVQHVRLDETYENVSSLVHGLQLHTVCESAHCPNMGECFGHNTATFLILGGICTRRCRFCAVPKGNPVEIDPNEAEKLAKAVLALDLKHVVITSVTRDDLLHGGAEQFADCIRSVRAVSKDTTIEILVPDFKGDREALNLVLNERPEVFNHNIETVPRLYATVRPIADYRQSLDVLHYAAEKNPNIIVKSGIMVGLGESREEITEVFEDLYSAGVRALTVGQYLQPSSAHIPVKEYISPEIFQQYENTARKIGFKHVASGPLVRSSYRARGMILECEEAKKNSLQHH